MTEIENETFDRAVVDMDGKRFVSCEFLNSTLKYTGGEWEWDNHTVFTACVWKFEDCALRTAQLLQRTGMLLLSGFTSGRKRR